MVGWKEWCDAHGCRVAKHGDPGGVEIKKVTGKGKSTGRHLNSDGYVLVLRPGHPHADKSGWVREHTYVMSNWLGRPLIKGENVHHLNGVRDDNRIKNLELWVSSQPPGQRPRDLLAWADEIIARYGERRRRRWARRRDEHQLNLFEV